MGQHVWLRTDDIGDDLRKSAQLSKEAAQTLWLLAFAQIYDGVMLARPLELVA